MDFPRGDFPRQKFQPLAGAKGGCQSEARQLCLVSMDHSNEFKWFNFCKRLFHHRNRPWFDSDQMYACKRWKFPEIMNINVKSCEICDSSPLILYMCTTAFYGSSPPDGKKHATLQFAVQDVKHWMLLPDYSYSYSYYVCSTSAPMYTSRFV